MNALTRAFADACYENSIEELVAALAQEEADNTDCEQWSITPDEWRVAIQTALDEKRS